MAWCFLIANIVTMFVNLGIQVYRHIKNKDSPDLKPIQPPTESEVKNDKNGIHTDGDGEL